MPRVNLTRQIKTDAGWKRAPLERDARGRIRWGNGEGRYLIEWREGGRRLRGAAGRTPAEALEAQRRKRLELEAKENNLELLGLPKEEDNILLDHALGSFLRDIKAFRNLCLANCYFSQDSSGFSVLLPFFDAQSSRSFHPFHRRPGSVARSWRGPFHHCGVASPQAPTLDRDSLTATIAEFMHVGPHPRRLNGTLGTSHSTAPFRNRSEAFDTAGPSQIHEQRKVPDAFSPDRRRKPGPKGPSAELIRAVVEMKQRNPRWGCPRIAQQIALAFHIQIDKDVVRRILGHHYRPGQPSGGPSWLTFLGHRLENHCACASLD